MSLALQRKGGGEHLTLDDGLVPEHAVAEQGKNEFEEDLTSRLRGNLVVVVVVLLVVGPASEGVRSGGTGAEAETRRREVEEAETGWGRLRAMKEAELKAAAGTSRGGNKNGSHHP
jgi:hypothetical protein